MTVRKQSHRYVPPSGYGQHLARLRDRARRPDFKDQSGRGQRDQAAVEESQADDEYMDDEEF